MLRSTGNTNTDIRNIIESINSLEQSVNQKQKFGASGLEGSEGDIRFVMGADNKPYFEIKGRQGWYTTFVNCLQLKSKNTPQLFLENLEVDNLFAKTFTVNQTNAINGNFVMSDFGIIESFTANTITFVDQTNLGLCGFSANDKCEVRTIKADSSADVKLIQFTVSSVSGKTITVTYTTGNATLLSIGDTVVRKGNSSNANRQASIYFSTTDTNNPYIDLYSGTTGFTYGTPIASIGDLTHITDADFGGALTGTGLYASNAYIKGKIYLANNGSISLGKTAYNDTTNAGFWLGDSDATATVNPYFYLGSASDAKYLKVDTVAGTFKTLGFEITSGVIQTSDRTSTVTDCIVIDGSTNTLDFRKAGRSAAADKVLTITSSAYGSIPGILMENGVIYLTQSTSSLQLFAGQITFTNTLNSSGVILDTTMAGAFNAFGVESTSTADTGLSYSVTGTAVGNGTTIGVRGIATNTGASSINHGLYGQSIGTGSSANYGVYGKAYGATSDANYAIYGSSYNGATNVGWAVFSNGNLDIVNGYLGVGGTGALSSGKFLVNSSGQITKINDITYAFPSVAPTLNQVLTCSNATGGVLSWVSPAGGGITSLNGLSGATQTFVNDTNVTIVSASTTHTITWSGTLADARIASASNWNAAYNNMIASASFNTGDGVITLTQQDSGTVTVDIDGRYLTSLSGAVLTTGAQTVNGTKTFEDGIYVGKPASGGIDAVIRMYDAEDVYYIDLKTENLTSPNKTITFPNATGTVILTDQTIGQTIGATGARLTKLWATDITCTNAITGSVTGNAGTVTNGVYTNADNSYTGDNSYSKEVRLTGSTTTGTITSTPTNFTITDYNYLTVITNDIGYTVNLTGMTTGQIVFISNTGGDSVTIAGGLLPAGASMLARYDGAAWTTIIGN